MFGYLMRNRVIFIGSRINDEVCQSLSLIFMCFFPCSLLARIQQSLNAPTALTVVSLLQVATNIVANLLAMEAINDTEDIKLYINSPGNLSLAVVFPHDDS